MPLSKSIEDLPMIRVACLQELHINLLLILKASWLNTFGPTKQTNLYLYKSLSGKTYNLQEICRNYIKDLILRKLGKPPGAELPPRNAVINHMIGLTAMQNLSLFLRYGLGLVTLILSILLKMGLNELVDSKQGASTPFLTIFMAIMITSWFWGFGPGVMVTLLGAFFSNYLFLEPQMTLSFPNAQDAINVVVFIGEGILISGLCEILRRAVQNRAAEVDERSLIQQELSRERERYAVTLNSIGDAVIATDVYGRVSLLNTVAQNMTGWSQEEAFNKELSQVFKIINEQTMLPVENPATKVLELGIVVGLANHTLLVTRDGHHIPIDDSGAPIKNNEGQTIGVVLVFRDVTERKHREEQQEFLIKASEILGSSLNHEVTLQNIVQLTIPAMADWCSIDLVEGQTVRRVASAHSVPAKQAIVHDLHNRFPFPTDQPHPLKDLLLAGGSLLTPRFSQPDLEKMSRSAEHLQTLKELGLKSGMTVPLIVRNKTVGAITLAITESERQYTEEDLTFMQELARRASLALDNSQLFGETQAALAQRTEAVNFHRQLEEQLTLLVEASDNLLTSLTLSDVLPAILDLARRLMEADAYGVWRYSPETLEWQTLATSGLSAEYMRITAESFNNSVTIKEPIIAEDVEKAPSLLPRLESYRKEGIRSILVIPLRIHGVQTGTIVFYYRKPHHFSQVETRVATALANLAAVAIGNAELYEEQTVLRHRAEISQQRLAFLAEASHLLSSSLDYTTTLKQVAQLVVPKMADWCGVYVNDQQGTPKQLALAHQDPAKVQWVLKLQEEITERYPYNPDGKAGLAKVIRTGEPELYPMISEEMLVAAAPDKEILKILQEIGYTSGMIVPLKLRDVTVGAIQFASTESRYHYNEQDLELAMELARRAAMAVDNARLYAEAQEAIAVREDFLSMAAHELKTPVTSLRGFAQLLVRQLDRFNEIEPTRLRRGLETINQQSERLLRLIVRLLDLTKLDAGRLVLEPELTDMTPLVERLIDSLRTTTEIHELQFSAPATAPALVDPLRVEQIITNLVDNAIKYSPEGGLIEISLVLLPERHLIKMSVKDQGLGIPVEHRDHIFEPFYQAQARGFAGIGMGLYITRQIVELHGGQIEIEFPAEGGTCFILTLPDGLN